MEGLIVKFYPETEVGQNFLWKIFGFESLNSTI